MRDSLVAKPKIGEKHGDLTNCTLGCVLVGWWRLGLFPLASVALATKADWFTEGRSAVLRAPVINRSNFLPDREVQNRVEKTTEGSM